MENTKLFIIVPCYNEEQVIEESAKRLTVVLEDLIKKGSIDSQSRILFVNDGSIDRTWEIIGELYRHNSYVNGVNLARNVGHQNALIAGITTVSDRADIIVSIDADLQDDVLAISQMVEQYHQGYDVVYGVRDSRASDTWFKRNSALAYYSLMKSMGVNLVYNHADYRLLSKRAFLHLLQYKERNLFLRGIVPLIGYNSTKVYYDRAERYAGTSKYPLKKMLSFAFDGITSFSVKPVHLVCCLGILFLCVALGILLWVVYAFINNKTVPGWSSLMLSLWFCTGCVLVSLGVIGEYVGKIFIEVKGRPLFCVEKVLLS